MLRRLPLRFAPGLIAALVAYCWLAGPARAQEEELADEHRVEATRAKMYDALDREVSALERQANVLKTIVKLVRPTVVHIEAKKIEASSLQVAGKQTEEAGSGVIVKFDGQDYVLTNRHVITSADIKKIVIRLADGREIHPTRKWDNQETDVAVMSVQAPNLIPARLGNSDTLEIGDFVLAVGSPFGLSHSITFGIVSATGRWDLNLGEGVKYQHFIQTDAAINPGNSGGPLINLRGEVIGMNTAIASSSGGNEGIGFSIPINLAISIARQLIEHNAVTKGFLGVQLDGGYGSAKAINVGLRRFPGARIKDVTVDSPAAVARLQPGDIIVSYGGTKVDNDSHLVNLVNVTEVGREVPLIVYRDSKALRVTIKVGAQPSGLPSVQRRPEANPSKY